MENNLSNQLEDEFNFHVPISILKGGEDGDEMVLGGIASTGDKDREGEMLMPEGFDTGFLMKSGYINWHHQMNKDPEAVIGEPIKAEVKAGKGLYIEGKLYKSSEMAKKAYQLAKTLNEDSTKRKLGWSIEGKVTERDPNNPMKVLKAKITGVALTPMPINPNTFVNVIKAMGVSDKALYEKYDTKAKEDKWANNGGAITTITMGNQSVNVRKGEEGELVISVKALTTDSARPLINESVEGRSKVTHDEPIKFKEKEKMSKGAIYERIFTNYPTLSVEDAKKVVEHLEQKENEVL